MSKTVFFHDPERGYALLGSESVTPEGISLVKLSVEEFLEPSPGIFYPSKATQEIFDTSGKPLWRKYYEASSVVVNDPDFTDDIFTIDWPQGTVVHDKMTGETFTTGKIVSNTLPYTSKRPVLVLIVLFIAIGLAVVFISLKGKNSNT